MKPLNKCEQLIKIVHDDMSSIKMLCAWRIVIDYFKLEFVKKNRLLQILIDHTFQQLLFTTNLFRLPIFDS